MLYAPSGGDPTAACPSRFAATRWRSNIPHAHADAGGMLTVSIGSATAQPDTKRSLAGLIQTRRRGAVSCEATRPQSRALHVDSAESDTPTGAFKVFAIK